MTSKLTREQLHERARENVKALKMASRQTAFESAREEILADLQLAEMALAAMESEPVAYMHDGEDGTEYNGHDEFSGGGKGIPLYRHAQPVLEIEREPVFTLEVARADYKGQKLGNHFGFITLDAARELKEGNYQLYTAQPAPVVPEEMTPEMMRAVQLNSELGAYAASNLSGAYDLFAEFWKVACRAAMLHAGNYPAIPEGSASMLRRWLAFGRGMQNAGSQLPHNLIAETESMLAAAPQSPGSEPATVPGKWIPVSEQKPENKPGSYEYLVFETLNNRVNHDYWNVPSEGDDAFTPFWNYYGEHVTHWMPLPAAPREVKGE